MGFLRFSLAVKYRILFGAAVLAIIAAALAVPWFRMEALALQQPFREAQRIADDYFRYALAAPTDAGLPGSVHGAVGVALLPERDAPAVSFHRFSGEGLFDTAESVIEDPFVNRAARALQIRRGKRWIWEADLEDGARVFRYAHAIRATQNCLSCHADGRGATPYREFELIGMLTVAVEADTAEAELLTNRLSLILAGALASVLAILIFYVITRRFILGPLHALREVAVRVAEGDLSARGDLQTGDEFEQLSDRMNLMLERLCHSQNELKRANRLLDQKMGEIAEHNVALYEANRLKSDFLANVSHELRTPLTSIIGFAELLREGDAPDTNGKRARYAENILISGRILLEIINDLLDLAKIEAGKVSLTIEKFNPHELCDALIEFARPLARDKKLWLTFDGDLRLSELRTDRGRLWQILFNLLSNAVKFSPEHGKVVLRCAGIDDDRVEFSVTDNGPGIAAEDQRVIFEKFRQVDQSKTREHQGTGLGLAIAKQLTLLLGGEIGVESRPGEGSRFWVRLPREISAPASLAPVSLV